MNEIFRKNMEVFALCHPRAYETIQADIKKFEMSPIESDGEVFHLITNGEGLPNLVYLRDKPPFRALFHSEEPFQEAEMVLENVDLRNPQTLLIFGMGLGYILRSFLRIRQSTNFALLIIEKNPQIFLRALMCFDWSEAFEDKTIYWSISSDLGSQRVWISSFFSENTTVSRLLKILATPQALASENDFYESIAKAALESRDNATVQVGNSIPDSLRGFENTLDNFDRSFANPGIGMLHNKFKGKICISVAAGPSLNDHWDLLKRVQGKIPIIACDTVLKPFQDHGIEADLITALERDSYVTDFFRGIYIPERTTLIAPCLLLPESFEEFKGRQLIYAQGLAYIEYLGLDRLGMFHPGSSAGNLNIALASLMGFSTVIMIGHNLAFGDKILESHVRGTIDPTREASRTEAELLKEFMGTKVPSQDGSGEVWTKMEWNLFRSQIELCVAANSEIKWINTAQKGAKIAGTITMTAEEAITKYGGEDFDFFPYFTRLVKEHSFGDLDRRFSKVIESATGSLKSLKKWNEKGADLLQNIYQWKKEIETAEASGSPPPLEFLNQRLDQVLDIKIEACNEDGYFMRAALSIILPAHAAFERTINSLFPLHKSDYALKKDFLLRHIQYFEVWGHWLPLIIARLESFLEKYKLKENWPPFPTSENLPNQPLSKGQPSVAISPGT